MRIVVMIGSATVAVIAASVAGSVVVIRLRTAQLDNMKKRVADSSTTVVRQSLAVTVDGLERCATSLLAAGAGSSTRQTDQRHHHHHHHHRGVSVGWADCALSPVDDEDCSSDQRQQTTTVVQHQFRMRIFPAAGAAYE